MSLAPKVLNFNQVWGELAPALRKIIAMENVKASNLYFDVYDLCTARPKAFSEELYYAISALLTEAVQGLSVSILNSHGAMLRAYLQNWDKYSAGSGANQGIFGYLNNNWVRKVNTDDSRLGHSKDTKTPVYDVWTLSMVVWRDYLFLKVKDQLMREILEVVKRAREGDHVDVAEIAGISSSFVNLGAINKARPLELYRNGFETPYLRDTREFYARESAAFLAANGVSSYMKKAEARIDEEQTIARKFLDPSSERKLVADMANVLIAAHQDHLNAEFLSYLKADKQEDLARMYHLLSRIESGCDKMLSALQQFITESGFEAVKSIPAEQRGDPRVYVAKLLSEHKNYSLLVETAFKNDARFIAALDKACRLVINSNPAIEDCISKSPELLAKFCDLHLKRGPKEPEAEIEQILQNALSIFKYVDDKDVFQKFYSRFLSNRLIRGLSASDDAERLMISGLKQICGYDYTVKLQRMFQDMALSTDLNDQFKEYLSVSNTKLKVDCTIRVLTAGSWPIVGGTQTFNIPQELEGCVRAFKTFYDAKHSGRTLSWLHPQSRADIRALCFKRKYDFSVTTFQMGIILQFNAQNVITVGELLNRTAIKDVELRRALQPLLDVNLLINKSEDPNLQLENQLELNENFSNKRMKLKLTAASSKETAEETKLTQKDIEEDRKLFLQAAIVRIMKARKTLPHQQLLAEVVSQVNARFRPNVPLIKKCIEILIDKEYLRRAPENSYEYLA